MDLQARALALLNQLEAGTSGISPSIFDAAWMSNVSKETCSGKDEGWMFPDCFQYLLDHQEADGGWASSAPLEDRLLHTAAALISLTYHVTDGSYRDQHCRAHRALQSQLMDMSNIRSKSPEASRQLSTMLVILQLSRVLVQNPLELQAEPYDWVYHVWRQPNRAPASGSSVAEDYIGNNADTPLLSPGTIAAIATYSVRSNGKLEKLLSQIHSIGDRGAIPALCPWDKFEQAMVLSVLLESHFAIDQSTTKMLELAKSCISEKFPTFADARLQLVTALKHSNANFDASRDISARECSPCLPLRALLRAGEDIQRHADCIESLTVQICNAWFATNVAGNTVENNASPFYSSMIMTKAFVDLAFAWESQQLPDRFLALIRDRVIVALYQCLIALLEFQNADGSWGNSGSAEETAYAVLTLLDISGLPFLEPLLEDIKHCQEQGQAFLRRQYLNGCHCKPSYLWKSHISFSSSYVAEAYVLAALKAETRSFAEDGLLARLFDIPLDRLPKLEDFYASLPMFQGKPRRLIRASLIEGYLFWPTLRSPDLYTYADKDSSRWLEYITFVFPACNNVHGIFAPTDVLIGLMSIMSGLYQIDSFIEHSIEKNLVRNVEDLHMIIRETFTGDAWTQVGFWSKPQAEQPHRVRSSVMSFDLLQASKLNDVHGLRSSSESPLRGAPDEKAADEGELKTAKLILHSLIAQIMSHPAVLQASKNDRHWLWTELRAFFYAQIAQVEEKRLLFQQNRGIEQPRNSSPGFVSPTSVYYRWLHSTGADSVGSPYQFAFFSILIANSLSQGNASGSSLGPHEQAVEDCWPTAREKFLAQSMSAGVARMWRIENDVGGIVRDRADGTVNSVNFSEFSTDASSDAALSEQLIALAERERRAWKADYAELEHIARGDHVREEKMKLVKLFTSAMELYGQIYIARDVWWKKADE